VGSMGVFSMIALGLFRAWAADLSTSQHENDGAELLIAGHGQDIVELAARVAPELALHHLLELPRHVSSHVLRPHGNLAGRLLPPAQSQPRGLGNLTGLWCLDAPPPRRPPRTLTCSLLNSAVGPRCLPFSVITAHPHAPVTRTAGCRRGGGTPRPEHGILHHRSRRA